MDSMALFDEADPEMAQADDARINSGIIVLCKVCGSRPAPGSKLRFCGRCRVANYCSKPCAQADWAEHKLLCESAGEGRDKTRATLRANGFSKGDIDEFHKGGISEWYVGVPGLFNEIALLAWANRGESPVIHVSGYRSGDASRGINVWMIPRSSWDASSLPATSDEARDSYRRIFDKSSFPPDEQYVLVMHEGGARGRLPLEHQAIYLFPSPLIRCVELVEALTAATRAEDLADAFAWIEKNFPLIGSHDHGAFLMFLRGRTATFLGRTTVNPNCQIVPSRALNNEVAHMMMQSQGLAFAIRLTGLVGAAHLNGREGIIRGRASGGNHSPRWTARLGDGTCVDVKPNNFVHVHGNYRRESDKL